ncbi:MAG TPA: hypothetical protein VMV88_08005, partial [Gallionella sp.]|nr:hypothetical protein [Gallionella sp.]
MKTNRETTVTAASQQRVEELQSESNIFESNAEENETLSGEDIEFIGELGWLAAAAVLVASLAAGV